MKKGPGWVGIITQTDLSNVELVKSRANVAGLYGIYK